MEGTKPLNIDPQLIKLTNNLSIARIMRYAKHIKPLNIVSDTVSDTVLDTVPDAVPNPCVGVSENDKLCSSICWDYNIYDDANIIKKCLELDTSTTKILSTEFKVKIKDTLKQCLFDFV